MICPKCGHDNPQTYRFCGMCGTQLERRRAVQPIDQPPEKPVTEKPAEKAPVSSSILGIAKQEPPEPPKREPPKAPEPPPRRDPAVVRQRDVLVQPRAEERPRVPARDAIIQPASRSSLAEEPAFKYDRPKSQRESSSRPFIYDSDRNASVSGPSFLGLGANYVEEDSHRGWRALAVLLAVLVIAGLVGFQWRRAGWQLPEAAGPTWEKVKSYIRGEQQPQPPPQNSTTATPAQPAPQATTTQVPGKAGDLSGGSKAPGSASTPSTPDTNATTPQTPTPNATSPQNDSNDNTDKTDGTTPQPPERSATKPSPAPSATPKNVKPARLEEHVAQTEWDAPVNEADQFINGRPQQCDRALGVLKDAAEHGNPRAGVKLGALYAAGVCVPQDNVTAYAWLSRAMKLDPNNRRLSAARSVVWNQMTSEEQQRAGQQ